MKKIISLLAIAFLILSQHSFVSAVEEICEYDYLTGDWNPIQIDNSWDNIVYIWIKDNTPVLSYNDNIILSANILYNATISWDWSTIAYSHLSKIITDWANKSSYIYPWKGWLNDILLSYDGKSSVYVFSEIIYETSSSWDEVSNYSYENFIVHNWDIGKTYDSISNVKLSHDGSWVIYKAEKDGEKFLVHNWKEIGKDHDITDYTISKDWDSYAYQAYKNRETFEEFMVFNWEKQEEYRDIKDYAISEDWESLIYLVLTNDAKNYLVVNSYEEELTNASFRVLSNYWNSIWSITFNNSVMFDWVEWKSYDDVHSITFSEDGKNIAYVAEENNRSFIVHNWVEWEKYDIDSYNIWIKSVWNNNNILYSINTPVSRGVFSPENAIYYYNGVDARLCNWKTLNFQDKEPETNIVKNTIEETIEKEISLDLDKSTSFKKVILSRRNLNRDTSTKKYASQIDRLVENMNDFWKIETILKKLYQVESKLKWKTDKKSIKLINIVDYLTGKMELRLIDKWNISTTTDETAAKELWNNFTLNQSLNNTQLIYEWNSIYTWSHTSEEVPFVWDEWCKAILNEFQNSNQTINNWKQEAWENLSSNEQNLCMKEFYSKNIGIEKITPVLFNVIEAWYEGSNKMLFNAKNQKLYQDLNLGFIIKALQTDYWVVIQSNSWYACDWKITLLNDWEPKLLFVNNCDVDERYKPDNYRKLQDFTLIDENTIKATYIWKDWKEERIIKID